MENIFTKTAYSPETTLATNITGGATTITVEDITVFPEAPNVATIRNPQTNLAETILYHEISGNQLQGVVRALEASDIARSWAVGTLISSTYTAHEHNAVVNHVNDGDIHNRPIVQIINFNTLDPHSFNLQLGETIKLRANTGMVGAPWSNQALALELTRTNQQQFLLKAKRATIGEDVVSLESVRAWSGGSWGNWDMPVLPNGIVNRSRMTQARMINNWSAHSELWSADNSAVIEPLQNGGTVQNGPFGNSRSLGFFFNEGSWNGGEGMLMVYGMGRPQNSANFLAIRQIRQGTFPAWRYVVTTTTFQAPMHPLTGKEMDVYECHYYLEAELKQTNDELETCKNEIETFKEMKKELEELKSMFLKLTKLD